MLRLPQISTRTYTLSPYTTLVRFAHRAHDAVVVQVLRRRTVLHALARCAGPDGGLHVPAPRPAVPAVAEAPARDRRRTLGAEGAASPVAHGHPAERFSRRESHHHAPRSAAEQDRKSTRLNSSH